MLLSDIRIATRRIARNPGYALGLIATLALGIAVCAAMYSVVHGVVVKGLDYPQPDRLVVLRAANQVTGGEPMLLSGAEAESLGEVNRTLDAAGYYFWSGATWLGGERPRMLTTIMVGGEFFKTLGATPQLGRWLTADDGDSGAVLSHRAWQELFGGDPEVIGKSLSLDTVQANVVGVMPPGFGFPVQGVHLWIGHDMSAIRDDPSLHHNARFFSGIGRLHTEATDTQLVDELGRHSALLVERHGGALRDWQMGSTSMLDDSIGPVRPVLLALLAIAGLALLVACANVVNLVVLRGVSRLQELGIQQALGASGGRLARVVFLETALLGLIATVVGVLLATFALSHFVGIGDSGVPRAREVRIDLGVVAVAAAIGMLASLIAAAVPAWRLWRMDAAGVMRGADARVIGDSGVSRVLPVAACAVSVGGLAAALLLTSSVWQLERVPLGFEPGPVLSLQMFRDPDPSRGGHARELIERMQALPGTHSAAAISAAPLSGIGAIPVDVAVRGRENQEPLRPSVRTVAGPIEDVLQLGLQRGRWLGPQDRHGSEQVAMINQAFAERVFPGQDPIGEVITVPPFGTGGERLPFRIVGVMADARLASVARPGQPELWLPEAQYWTSSLNLLLRADGDPALLTKPAQEAVWALYPERAIHNTRTLASMRDAQLATPRFFARNAGAFAVLALMLAAIGVHSVVAFQMARRRREFALRLALGSPARRLVTRVLRYGYALGLPAAVAGALIGIGFGQLLKGSVVGIDGSIWPAAIASAVVLLLIVLAACARSMLGVLRVQPMAALRND